MNVLLCGYGNMGKEVEQILLQQNHQVTASIDPKGNGMLKILTIDILRKSDVVIEFSHADAAAGNASLYLEAGIPAVVGTTGIRDTAYWSTIREGGIAYLLSENFSVGAYLFRMFCKSATQWTNALPEYDLMLNEFHHKGKKDSPSGTALQAAETIVEHSTRKSKIQTNTLHRPILPEELHVTSVRGGAIPGLHSLVIDTEADSIEITHRARSRHGFALGAVRAAEWILTKSPGLYTTDDYMEEIIRRPS